LATAAPRRRRAIKVALVLAIVGGLVVATAAADSAALDTVPVATATPTPLITPSPSPSPTPSPTPEPTPVPTPSPTPAPTEPPVPNVSEYRIASGTEPGSAADPFRPGVVAIVSESIVWKSAKVGCSRPAVRVSKDGGITWSNPSYPWGVACQDIHAVIAWGPNGRLWVGDAIGVKGGVAMSVTHSDDMGKTWSRKFTQNFTPPWVGCYASLSVDNRPGSPNFGTVYVAYNWLPNKYGPGVSIMASRDGSTWVHGEVPLGPAPSGYPYAWRLGYRIEAAPDGTAYVTFYESSLKRWSTANIFNEGFGKNIGRRGYEIAHVHFDGKTLTGDKPVWMVNTDIAETQFQSGLTVDDNATPWLAVESKSKIRLVQLGGLVKDFAVSGYNFKPSLAISGRTIFLGWHVKDKSGKIWTYYTISYDDGVSFLPPARISNGSWLKKSAPDENGVGLREQASFANGVVYYAYGDARNGLAVYLAVIKP
jgi:hypothetical protein